MKRPNRTRILLLAGACIALTLACGRETSVTQRPPTATFTPRPPTATPKLPTSTEEGPEIWSAADCSGFDFVSYDFTIEDQFSSSASSYCGYKLVVLNTDDTIQVYAYAKSLQTGEEEIWAGLILAAGMEGNL